MPSRRLSASPSPARRRLTPPSVGRYHKTMDDDGDASPSPAAIARRLLRAADRGTLATSLEGWPYASLVLVATAPDGAPLLLLSTLARHTAAIAREPRVSLLIDGTAGLEDPLTG